MSDTGASDLRTEPWSHIRPLSRTRELAAVWMFVKRALLLQTHFKFSFITSLLNTSSHLVIYGMIARFGQSVPEIAAAAESRVVESLRAHDVVASSVALQDPTLEDAFIALTGKRIEASQ